VQSKYCFVVSIKANPNWLQVDRPTRNRHWDAARTIINEYVGRVSFNYFDADAFRADMSDMVICTTNSPLDFHHLWDRIKDTDLFCQGYYSIVDVRFGIKGVSHG